MSTHDHGAFGALLAEAKALGVEVIYFGAVLGREDELRWHADAQGLRGVGATSHGRTGEEALRRVVEALRVAPPDTAA